MKASTPPHGSGSLPFTAAAAATASTRPFPTDGSWPRREATHEAAVEGRIPPRVRAAKARRASPAGNPNLDARGGRTRIAPATSPASATDSASSAACSWVPTRGAARSATFPRSIAARSSASASAAPALSRPSFISFSSKKPPAILIALLASSIGSSTFNR